MTESLILFPPFSRESNKVPESEMGAYLRDSQMRHDWIKGWYERALGDARDLI